MQNITAKVTIGDKEDAFVAAGFNDADWLKILLNKGVDIEASDKENGRTLLGRAALSGSHQVVSLLLERGAEFNCYATDGYTPLATAMAMIHWHDKSNILSIIYMLRQRGAKLELSNVVDLKVLKHFIKYIDPSQYQQYCPEIFSLKENVVPTANSSGFSLDSLFKASATYVSQFRTFVQTTNANGAATSHHRMMQDLTSDPHKRIKVE